MWGFSPSPPILSRSATLVPPSVNYFSKFKSCRDLCFYIYYGATSTNHKPLPARVTQRHVVYGNQWTYASCFQVFNRVYTTCMYIQTHTKLIPRLQRGIIQNGGETSSKRIRYGECIQPNRQRGKSRDSHSNPRHSSQYSTIGKNMNTLTILFVVLGTGCIVASLRDGECEVCTSTVNKFAETLDDSIKQDPKKIEMAFKKFCKGTKSKENRFCYYLGGLEESATGILGELSKPLSWSMPADKICDKLKKKDAQICDLRFDKQIDLNTVDLRKLKVRDLKKILNDWEETCDGCIEKTDFIKRIEELKPKYSTSAKSEL